MAAVEIGSYGRAGSRPDALRTICNTEDADGGRATRPMGLILLHKLVVGLARSLALLGGLVLCLLVVMVCVSILGREVNAFAHSGQMGSAGDWLISKGIGPILGDFELVEAGIAFAIFAFLPLTQLNGNHATVDVFTKGFGPRINNILIMVWEVVMAAVIILISWRLFVGLQDKMRYNETTYLIQFPIWWAYAASFSASVVAVIVSIYCAATRLLGRPQT